MQLITHWQKVSLYVHVAYAFLLFRMFCCSIVIYRSSYPGECDLMVHPQKYTIQRHSLINALCYLRAYVTCTRRQNQSNESQCLNVLWYIFNKEPSTASYCHLSVQYSTMTVKRAFKLLLLFLVIFHTHALMSDFR